MKRIFIFLSVIALTSCNYFYDHIEFNGKTASLTGNVIIKDGSGNAVYGATIQNGSFHIKEQQLVKPGPGYYELLIPGNDDPFEIYLEPGTYNIETRKPGIVHYPIISTTSKIQNELSAYYTLADSIKHATHDKMITLVNRMNSPAALQLPQAKYQELLATVKEAQTRDNLIGTSVIDEYMKRYPQSIVIAHIMANINYATDPEKYYKLYQKFSDAAKKSDDGYEIGEKLKHLVKLIPGGTAPELVGTTPDGKTIDLKKLNKKVILVEFWKAGIVIARKNHKEMVNGLLPNLADKGFGIVSVSFDDKRDWWVSAIKDDKMTWPQVNDLKGFESPNVDNWGISDIPMYKVLDGQGRIIANDIPFDNIMFTVTDYLEKHP
jgi:hypothetical protein